MLSVVIPNYNGKHYLQDCLESIAQQTYHDYEVIVVDNASSDGSIEYIARHFPRVRIIRCETNLGFAGGTNRGIREAKGEFILTLNNDTTLLTHFFDNLLEAIEQDDSIGMCASKMLFQDGRINAAGICISKNGAAYNRGMFEADDGTFDTHKEIFGPCAGAALYRKKMLDEIGLFDEDFFLYMEDVDLAFRAQLAGWRCIYTPYARVVHVHGGTAGSASPLSIYYTNRNSIWCIVKNYPMKYLIRYFPGIVGRHVIVIPYYILKGKGITVIRSKIDALKGLHAILKKRKHIQNNVKNDDVFRYVCEGSPLRVH